MPLSRTAVKIIGTVCCFCISLIPASGQRIRKGELSARQIAQRTFPSVVVLIAEDRSGDEYLGSGFFIDDNIIATNYHVIKSATQILARRVGQKHVYRTSVLSFDVDKDLALLRLDGAVVRPLTLARGNSISVGDTVYVAGNPEGLEGTFSQGIVSALRGSDYVQITAPISHGSSGGPVLNTQGEVIGLAAGTIEQGQNLNFAIPASLLRPQLAAARLLQRIPGTASSKGSSMPDREKPIANDEGSRLLSENSYAEAAEAFKRVLREKQDDIHALLGLATAYENLHNYEQAIDVYKDLIRTHPEEERAYEQLGFWLLAMKLQRHEEDIEILKHGISAIPTATALYTDLDVLLESDDRFIEAEAILRIATAKAFSPSVAYMALSDLYCDHMNRCRDSIQLLKSAIEASPEADLLHYALGRAYLKMGDRALAMKEYQTLKKLKSDWAEGLFRELYK